jgi:pyruvate dehydrogenase E2 component (dihydrolipoamide acetyltransferase)
MATPIRVPRVGQAAEEATLVEWLRSTGDEVAAGDVVATVETDKTEIEVECPAPGVLGELRLYEGETYAIGTLMVYVLAPGEREPVRAEQLPDPPAEALSSQTGGEARVAASPRARRLAGELGVDLARLSGTGPGGLVTERDVERGVARTDERWQGRLVRERRRLASLRARSARHLSETWSITPHFVQMVDVDLTDTFTRADRAPGHTVLAVAAVARALTEHPHLNAAYDDGELVEFAEVNIAIAVDTDRGLDVPVVPRADRLDLGGLQSACRDRIERARSGQLTADDRAGASATVSNLGAHGITAGTPVLRGPEAVLVFMGAAEPRAVVRDGSIVVRTIMTLSCAFDHRVVDGVTAAAFVGTLKELLESSDWLS